MKEEEGLKENVEAEEVEKEVIEEKRVCMVDGSSLQSNYNMGSLTSLPKDYQHTPTVNRPSRNPGEGDGGGDQMIGLSGSAHIYTLWKLQRALSTCDNSSTYCCIS
ncbi:PREDICTED: kinesin [Prunus dulcis]|uniref:PREDICTED: kinesin n=1 Tax=Prunus dulcis TaxID=3755 RepID=A0A5E4E1Z6_PRUDU|nr:PREDICTED: kinesin [Prunus dulcis]